VTTQLLTLAFERPAIDWHAVAPELTLLAVGCLITLIDIIFLEKARPYTATLAGLGVLATAIPIITLAMDGVDRVLFDGAYVVDDFALFTKAIFLISGYVVILLSTNYVAEGDYWENEYYGLLLASLMGMVMMSSSRDLISIFVALELLSIPAYLMVAWRKRDARSNEAGLKYYLMGVFASAVMLYGMSLLFGVSGSTQLSEISSFLTNGSVSSVSAITLAIVFVVAGFAFKVSAAPFHTWAPDVYEGAPTPVTAFLSVASKAAGFVALLQLIYVGFHNQSAVYEPLIWILAAASMTFGNLVALKQTNIVRMMAYSGVAQTGFILAPLAVAGHAGLEDQALSAILTYLAIYAAMNLGAFAVIITLSRKTGSAEIESFNGAFRYAPAMTVSMAFFLFSLAGIPPLGGWFAKFEVFSVLASSDDVWGYALAVIAAINSVIALYYYASVARRMWADEAPENDLTPVSTTSSLVSALAICAIVTLAFGVVPQIVGRFADVTLLTLGG
jgi:NADH-quinone oxidoreductase subunit N|tara:strand:- start:4907 stop:6415 length:1509 start_codon:yes stop_codon:yes gene_type:complete